MWTPHSDPLPRIANSAGQLLKILKAIMSMQYPQSNLASNLFFLCPFFRYLRKDHIKHCVPSNVSSGLATLPLSFVYVNNTADKSKPTNKSLPTGEMLNGKKSYQQIVSYFTTNTMSPGDIYKLGLKMLNELFPQVSVVINKIGVHPCILSYGLL